MILLVWDNLERCPNGKEPVLIAQVDTSKHCKFCGSVLRKTRNIFCNKSCAASYNNRGVRRHGKPKGKCVKCEGELHRGHKYCPTCWKILSTEERADLIVSREGKQSRGQKTFCLFCGSNIFSYRKNRRFCNGNCMQNYVLDQRIKAVLVSGDLHKRSGKSLRAAKRVLIKVKGHKCEVCGRSKWMGKPIPLVYDHIDGDHTNGRLDNARLVCGNCDMQLSTYKSKNKGNGRKWRK